ncbi:MAG: hypothetical protein ABMA64_28475 [Myxococcota bacterium]
MSSPQVPPPIVALASAVAAAGGRIYLVGGGVRDHLTGGEVKDWDLEVFGLAAEALSRLLRDRGSINEVGRSFGVYKWTPRGGAAHEIDVSIPRRDSKVGPGHKGIAVEGDPTMSLVEAARRRDLTINAMMWDLVHDRLEDPWGGRDDLQARRLRAVDPATFLEDPLRALRVVQFAARLGFDADPSLVEICRAAALDELPAERICGEWGKLLLRGREISRGLRFAREARITQRVFPTVADLDTDAVVDRATALRDGSSGDGWRWALMLAAWLYPAAPPAITAALDVLGMHTVGGYRVRERVMQGVALRSAPIATDADLRNLSAQTEVRLALALREAVGEPVAEARDRASSLGVLDAKPAPLLLGRHLAALGCPPGRKMGEVVAAVYQQQLDGVVSTLDQATAAAAALLARGD